ncbi:MAG: hypothetical protein IJ397_00945 [Lachnospiraceae bacterium]|nr:hypothetical protein [Lachnospiraceae bacterium]
MQEKIFNTEEVRIVYDSIKELYLSYCEELEITKKDLVQMENDIKDAQDYLSYLSNHQNSDTFVFSPRGVISKNSGSVQESVYDTGNVIDFTDTQKKKDEIVRLESNKRICEEKINKLNSTIAVLTKNKEILKDIISVKDSFDKEQKSFEEQKNLVINEYEQKRDTLKKEINDGVLDKIEYLSHRIDMMDTYIFNDSMRAKLELKEMKQEVAQISECLVQLVRVPEGDN